MKKIKGNFPNDLSIKNSLTKNKVLFALWATASYATLGLSVYSYLKYDQLMGNIFLDASLFSFANGLKYGLRAENREKEIKELKKSGISNINCEKEI